MSGIGFFPVAGAIVFNLDGSVDMLSESARRIIAQSDALNVCDARLHAVDGAEDLVLQNTIRDSVRNDPTGSPDTACVVVTGRSSLLTLHFSALTEGLQAVAGERPRVLGLISASTHSGFTAAEKAVAELLWRGLRLRAIAEQRGTTLETVRTQAKAIYGKLGVQSRTQMMAVFAGRIARSGNGQAEGT